jgi:hypothetical protein
MINKDSQETLIPVTNLDDKQSQNKVPIQNKMTK